MEALKRVGPNPSKEAAADIEAECSKRTTEINNRYPELANIETRKYKAESIFSEAAFVSPSTLQGLMEWLHFERHRIPFKQDAERTQAGNWEASRRIQRTIADAEQIRCGGGPILPFQGNLEHSNIFENLWGLGIENLTQEELADFFDKYCPCGIENHDPGALKKHRDRFQKAIGSATDSEKEGKS